MGAVTRALLVIYDYLVLYLGLIWLGLQCLAWTPVALLVAPLLPSSQARALGRYVITTGFRLYLASLSITRRCRFDLSELDALRGETGLIIAPNHPSLLDAVMVISRLPNVACVLKASLMNNVFLGAGARLAHYIRNEDARQMVKDACGELAHGSHLLVFPEGTRTLQPPVNTLKGGIALIARRAGVPVQTVLIETDSPYLSKGWPLFRMPPMPIHYRVRLGRRFEPPHDIHAFMAELEDYYAEQLPGRPAAYPGKALPNRGVQSR